MVAESSDGVDGGDPGVPNDSDDSDDIAHVYSAISKLLQDQFEMVSSCSRVTDAACMDCVTHRLAS